MKVSESGFNVVFSSSTHDRLAIHMTIALTGTLELEPAATDRDRAPLFTAIIGNAASAEFDCPLLAGPTDSTIGCGVRAA